MSNKLDTILLELGEIKGCVKLIVPQQVQHDKRLASLEQSRSWVLGMSAMFATAGAVIAFAFGSLVDFYNFLKGGWHQ